MPVYRELKIGDMSESGQITIIDKDRLCYIVKSVSRGAEGIRTISKAILKEFVDYVSKHSDATPRDARIALSGTSQIDKYEYGYESTILTMAKMVLGYVGIINDNFIEDNSIEQIPENLQHIYYGAPGTGKSHSIDKLVTEDNSIRTTFHPDSDYASFVGCYKPVKSKEPKQEILEYDKLVEMYKKYIKDLGNVTHASAILGYNYHDSIVKMTENGKHSIVQLIIDAYKPNTTYDTTVRSGMLIYEESQAQKRDAQITYDFVPQAFTRAYIEAWKDTSKPYYLVIEEINRGNCAQIFGDIFQLLDRGEDGFSSYKITPDTDLQQYLAEEFAKVDIADADIKAGRKMQLPNNLHILATMNTSDQSLFPIDSAFKRRWEWKYIPIKNEGKNHKIVVDGAKYDWFEFMKLVNDRIENVTDSEDKQIGYWFAKANEKDEISAETLVSKVIFYLWNDVFKDYAHSDNSLFNVKNHKYKFREFYHENGDVNTILLKQFLKELGLKDETSQTSEVPSAEENQEPEQPAEE